MSKLYSRLCTLKTLPNLVHDILEDIGENGIILLRGTLASGKTSFVQAFATALGIKENIGSPTFCILHEYDKSIFHYDIYQCGSDGFLQNGLMEKFDEKGYHLIEWGDEAFEKILQRFGIGYSTVDITLDNSKRLYKVHINAYA